MTASKLTTGIAVATALVVVAYFFAFNPFVNMSSQGADTFSTVPGDTSAPVQLVVQDEVIGNGTEARVGDQVMVHYTGRLQDGAVFDSSIGRDPIQFTLGIGEVIPGWDQGLQGMKVGGKRLLVIPSSLAYGPEDYGPIPGNSTLIFEVELMGVTKGGTE